ncbi:hypothetical protein C8J57DRAFT_1069863, partial [Mycena rebaudengoi]
PHIRHEAIDVPDHRNPLSGDEVMERRFFSVLGQVLEADIVPAGYGIMPEEWEDEGYPNVEVLTAGKLGKTKIWVSLANIIWKQRAKLWVQALNVLSHFDSSAEMDA